MLFPPAALVAAERSGEVSLSAEPSVSGGTAEAKPHGAIETIARAHRVPGGGSQILISYLNALVEALNRR
jgi:hypothetical protein